MQMAEKTRRIQRILDELHPEVPVPLRHADPYTLLVAVMLSAQTTDKQVNKVTPRLFALAADPAAMAALPVSTIEAAIRGLGLAPTKARNLSRGARLLVERHQGQIPSSLGELQALPGVGRKTALVVQSQAFGIPTFPVDTHIHRLAARWGLSSGKNVRQTEEDLKALFPRPSWSRLHLQFIYFGRTHCPARGHDMAACPICSWAAAPA